MGRLRERLLAADVDTESESPPTGRVRSSDPVDWQDMSTETNGPTGWASGIDPVERGLSESEDAFAAFDADQLVESILDGLAVPMFVVDRAGEIAYLNSAACEVFETAEPDALGSTPTTVHGGQQLLGGVLSTGEAVVDHRETVGVDGTQRTLSRTLEPLEDDPAGIVGVVETIRPLSEPSRDGDSPQ